MRLAIPKSLCTSVIKAWNALIQGSPTWYPRITGCPQEYVSRPRACSKNNISMVNVFTLTNINTKIIKDKLSKIFISEACIKLVALHINRYTRSSSQFQKRW